MPEKKRIIVGVANIPEGVVEADIRSGQITTTMIATDAVRTTHIGSGQVALEEMTEAMKRTPMEIRIPADSAASDTWTRPLVYAHAERSIVDAGIIPESEFGQSGDAAIIALVNKGTIGQGTRTMVTKTFSSAISGQVFTSLGTITSGYVASGEMVVFQKTNQLSGQIVPASLLVATL